MGRQIFWSRVDGDGGAGMMKYPLSAMILPVFELVKISINIDKLLKGLWIKQSWHFTSIQKIIGIY